MQSNTELIESTKSYIEDFFKKNIDPKYVFHDLEHTTDVVAAAEKLATGYDLEEVDKFALRLAAWFHDTGYDEGAEMHEERSCKHAENFLKDKVADAVLDKVSECIRATKMPQNPTTLIEQILCDADLSHLGMKSYWARSGKFRQEYDLLSENISSEPERIEREINFLMAHEYHTTVAREMFNKRKVKNVQKLIKQKKRLNPNVPLSKSDLAVLGSKDKQGNLEKAFKKSQKQVDLMSLGRGVETMYRTTYRTNNNLSRMADSKANMMLSINTIVISIVVSSLLPRLSDNTHLALPTFLLLLTCLLSIIYATLSTRPSITEGKVTKESILDRTANLLFFGNFYKMPLKEYQWGINEMLGDPEFLYNTLSKDLYFLGIVLAKKYRFLSICYNVFMYGLIISLSSFVIAFLLQAP